MNPLTKVKLTNELNEREVQLGVAEKVSWHSEYKDSAWIFLGGLPYELTEGDVICVFSQYGEVVNINLVWDKKTGKSKGFCFLCYEDQRSTFLAVDNFNGIKIKGRTIQVDHVANYQDAHYQRIEINALSNSCMLADDDNNKVKHEMGMILEYFQRSDSLESSGHSNELDLLVMIIKYEFYIPIESTSRFDDAFGLLELCLH
ncbi:RNA-binding motif protein, X-linked 2-like [Lepus europaeus]|uniref:RNA-binding motif protein, X-linked 2-like n=1 Tax=Lepus europaeus TaxID=9983 RepID=UPI002B48C1DA|nr:RNA-binding motif protein, X-linked 2-like [Lepus europaeus]